MKLFGNYTKYTLGNCIQTNNAYNTFGLLQNKSVDVYYIQVVRNEIILYFKLVKIK
jgi:hypothetical protein